MKETLRRGPRTAVALGASAAALALVVAPAPAEAQSAPHKLGRGLAAVTTGFLEIPGHVVKEGRRNGAVAGATIGLAKGLGFFVTRELVGVYEIVTSPFPMPAGYAPILEPEYPWDHFD